MNTVKLYLQYAGYCHAQENHAIRGGTKQTIPFQALFGLIHHPVEGWILFDTGYARRFYDATAKLPHRIYAHATQVFITEDQEAQNRLRQLGIKPEEIKHVIITHFHADHIAGLKDFSQATIHCSRAAYQDLHQTTAFWGFRKGILKSLLPNDFEQRVSIIEKKGKQIYDPLFEDIYDLFDDGTLLAYPLPGHAAGQIGVLLKTKRRSYFLISDACWLRKSYKDLILPHSIVRLFFASWNDFKRTLIRVHRFHQLYPETLIVPTHCSETTKNLVFETPLTDEL
jgi:glyoxylase-like metal-dependent hydrolase (beta-lactamase superfamily II)